MCQNLICGGVQTWAIEKPKLDSRTQEDCEESYVIDDPEDMEVKNIIKKCKEKLETLNAPTAQDLPEKQNKEAVTRLMIQSKTCVHLESASTRIRV